MEALEQKILSEGKVLPGNILKVGSFLNQQIDTPFMLELGKEIANRFKSEGVTKIPVETQLDITYDREGGKTFTVFTGAEFEIHGVKYKVKSLEAKNGKPVVTIQDVETKKQKILQGT